MLKYIFSAALAFAMSAHSMRADATGYSHRTFHDGDSVVVIVSQGRTTGVIQHIDGDGIVVVSTPSGFDNYQGPISNVLWQVPQMNGFTTGESVTVQVRQGRVIGTIQRIDSDAIVTVSTASGYDNYQGPISYILKIESSTHVGQNEFYVGEEVVVEVRQGRTTGTIQRIDADGNVLVSTPSGFDNYEGSITYLIRELRYMNGLSIGESVAVDVQQGRTTGTIRRIDSDGMISVTTGSGFNDYLGPVSGFY